ncbi:MAG TPA: LON peptidase substrate-binding domain-containing protein [Trueperaceae bacterium]|nr:LON peptidase substrate-binding domain-containing protein [Trueperaceae bacterium]
MHELPIFPLDVVVFPGMTVPVNVHEQRYRQLIRLVLAQEAEPKRFIAVLAGETAPIRDVQDQLERYGTVVHVLSVEENDDGSVDVVVHGQERCEVVVTRREEVSEPSGAERPLYFAEYQPAPVGRGDPNTEAVAAWDAIDTFRTYAGTLFKGDAAAEIDMHLPEDPLYQASFLCANIRVPPATKQPLLDAPSLTERFELARHIMLERMERRQRARRGRA